MAPKRTTERPREWCRLCSSTNYWFICWSHRLIYRFFHFMQESYHEASPERPTVSVTPWIHVPTSSSRRVFFSGPNSCKGAASTAPSLKPPGSEEQLITATKYWNLPMKLVTQAVSPACVSIGPALESKNWTCSCIRVPTRKQPEWKGSRFCSPFLSASVDSEHVKSNM